MADKLAAVNAVCAEIEKRKINAARKRASMESHVSQVKRFYNRLRRSPNLAAHGEDAGNLPVNR